MVISEKNKLLINRVLDTVDWELILKFYKLVGRSVGAETTQIPGIKKLARGIKMTEEHIKEEVHHLVNHIVENDLSSFLYGPWNVIWVNGEWEIEIPEIDEKGNEVEGGESTFEHIQESLLEIHFSPMIVVSKELVIEQEEENQETSDLERQLEKALQEENYEAASKIRDLIEIYRKKK